MLVDPGDVNEVLSVVPESLTKSVALLSSNLDEGDGATAVRFA